MNHNKSTATSDQRCVLGLGERLRNSKPGSNGQPERTRRRQLHQELDGLRSSIQSSLTTLLMTRRPATISDWRRWPHAESSVLNYGVPDLSGMCASGVTAGTLKRTLKQIISRFEPRLHPGTLNLEVTTSRQHPESLMLWIEANIGPRSAPEAFAMGMTICLVTGHAHPLQDRSAA